MTSDLTVQPWFGLEPSLLRVFEEPSMEKWAALGSTFQAMGAHRMWWVGDWRVLGEQVFGEESFQEAGEELERETGYSYNTVRVAAWVASKFPPGDRIADISWRHHKEVAGVESRDRRRQLLEQTRDEDWTIARLRREVKRYRDGGDESVTKETLRIVDGTWVDMLKVLIYERFDLLVADVRRDDLPVDVWLPPALQLLLPRHGLFIICEPKRLTDLELGLRAHDQVVRSHIAWAHPNALGHTDVDLAPAWDVILYLGTRPLNQLRRGSRRRDVQMIPAEEREEDSQERHIASKSSLLMRWLLEIGSKSGESVLDIFHGDDATVAACQSLGRHCTTAVADPLRAEQLRTERGHAVLSS